MKPRLGSNSLHPVAYEEPFEQFKDVSESVQEHGTASSSCNESNYTIKSCGTEGICSSDERASSSAPSLDKSSALLLSLSPPSSGREACGKLVESVEASKTEKENLSDPAGDGLRLSHCLGEFRGMMGGKAMERPSPASRLSFVDRKWLERCQVFGELMAEERPGAGNQEVDLTKKQGDRRLEESKEDKKHRDDGLGEGEREEAGETRRGHIDRDEGLNGNNASKVSAAAQRKRKKDNEVKETRDGDSELERGLTAPEDDSCPKSRGTKKRGTKRQRQDDNVDGQGTEGRVKKRRRKGKKKEDNEEKPSSPEEGVVKKRRTKKKDEEEEERKQNTVVKKVGKEVIVFVAFFMVQLNAVRFPCEGPSRELVRRNRG